MTNKNKIENIKRKEMDIKGIVFFDDGKTARLYLKNKCVWDFQYKTL